MNRRIRNLFWAAAADITDLPVCAAAFIASLPPRILVWIARVSGISRRYAQSRWRAENFAAPAVIVGVCAFLGGCNTRPYVSEGRLDSGLVLILPGIEGPGPLNASIRRGLYNGGVPCALEIYNWQKHRPGVSYAFNETAARERAAELAERIEAYRAERPGRPVFVVGHSGGGAMAVFAAEAVGKERPIDGVVTLAPALSPGYDLTRALAGCSGRFLNCYSTTDYFLRTLTGIGCNFDGVRGRTAGQEGFSCAAAGQLEWDESMRRTGNWGGHRGWASSRWVAETLAPLLLEWAGKTGHDEGGGPGGESGGGA